MTDETIKATLSNISDLLGAANNVEPIQPDVALRYRLEASSLLSDLGHGLLARAARVKTDATIARAMGKP
jgi:hypothetical protein